MKVHLSRARELIERSPSEAEAEAARAQLLSPSSPSSHRVQETIQAQRDLAKTDLLAIAVSSRPTDKEIEQRVLAEWRPGGQAFHLLAQARGLLQSHDSPRLHQILMEGEIQDNNPERAAFHLEHSRLSWPSWFYWQYRIWQLRLDRSWLFKVGQYLFLVLLFFLIGTQARQLWQDLHPTAERTQP